MFAGDQEGAWTERLEWDGQAVRAKKAATGTLADIDAEAIAVRGELKRYAEQAGKELDARERKGLISESEALRERIALRLELAEKAELLRREQAAAKGSPLDYAEAVRALEAEVRAGSLSLEDAADKLQALRKATGGEDRRRTERGR